VRRISWSRVRNSRGSRQSLLNLGHLFCGFGLPQDKPERMPDGKSALPDIRKSLDGEIFQILIVGGGISGVAIARECALAGQKTLLVEQHDFSSGTTSRSTRIIHGGLRYLEHGDFAQVRDSLRERQRLLTDYPHLVRPLHFLLTLDENSHRRALAVRFGLWLYRRLGAPTVQNSGNDDVRTLERLLDAGRRWSTFDFDDAQCEFPERLVAEWLTEAMLSGAMARNHTELLAVKVQHGHVTGAVLRDRLTGKEDRVSAKRVINATGPWADRITERTGIAMSRRMIGGVRGSHIVLPRFSGAPDAAVYTEAVDARPIFVIPWNSQILVGTTEVPDNVDPGRVQPSSEEISYLLHSFQRLFPSCGISRKNVRYAFAGVRPLPSSPHEGPSETTRRHQFYDHAGDGAAGLISVVGGKLTTAAQLARECAAKIGIPQTRLSSSIRRSTIIVGGGPDYLESLLDREAQEIARIGSLTRSAARAIVEWHGRRSPIIAESAQQRPELREPLCSHGQHIVAEAVDSFTNECAVTLGDVLLRRLPVALGPCWSSDCTREAAIRIGGAMGWNDSETGAQMEAFEAERDGFLQQPADT